MFPTQNLKKYLSIVIQKNQGVKKYYIYITNA